MHENPQVDDIRNDQLSVFLVLAFGLAWAILGMFIAYPDWATATFGALSGRHPLFLLAVYAPALSALIVILRKGGTAGLLRFLSRLLTWRTSIFWFAFLILGFPAIFFAGAALQGTAVDAPLLTESLAQMLPVIGFMMILGPVEEIGWRGLALPLLQRRLAPFWAGLVLGLIWAVWHLPAFLLSGTPQAAWDFMPFLAGSVACSIMLTGMFNASNGSILLSMLFHFQMNNPLWPDAQPYDMYLFVLAAAVIVTIKRHEFFLAQSAWTVVVPVSAAKGEGR